MEIPAILSSDEDSIELFDASDEFPFSDCSDSFDDPLEPATSSHDPESSPESSPMDSSSISDEKQKGISDLGEKGKISEPAMRFASEENETEDRSNVTRASEIPSYDSAESASELNGSSSFNLLFFLVKLVIKAIDLQTSLFVKMVTFPIWGFFNFYIFVIDPFRTIRDCREFFVGKVSNFTEFIWKSVSPFVHEWFKDQSSVLKLALRYGWGLLCGFYVFVLLCCLLASSLVLSGLLMRRLVEEPIQVKQVLNFDFTKVRPVAYVPIISGSKFDCGVGCDEKMEFRRQVRYRVIPASHKLQIVVLFTVPESEYNRNLGIFQVRVDLVSAKGETLATSSHPCMLEFRSEPIRLLSTFLRVAPLITGYGSETQTLGVKFKGLVEGEIPTASLKVSIEQRAEYRPGAGIPEIYESSVILESELPLLKRWVWYWKITLFVWTTMALFMLELLCALLCCRPILIPRLRARVRTRTRGRSQTQTQTRL